MLNLLTNWKNYLLVALVVSNVLLYFQKLHTDNKYIACQNETAAIKAAIDLSNKLQAEQKQELDLREEAAAKAQADSQKRKDDIISKVIKGGCEGVNQFLLDFALGFQWDNNIP